MLMGILIGMLLSIMLTAMSVDAIAELNQRGEN